MKELKIFHAWFLMVLAFCSALAAQENNEIQQDIRIAVIDVGSKEAPDSFSQFLWINIAEQPNIVLVEREQINKILKEQALNLQFGDNSDNEYFVKAGEILGADFLLMFESGGSAQGQVPVRFRLVETRYGMKFWDYALLLDKDEKKHPEQAKEISETIISRFQAKNKYGNFTYVAIGAFRSEELSQNWNWISDELAAGIEQKLVNQPSIVLLERRRTRPLMNERDLVEGLPDALRSSTVFIDGSYRLDRQKNDKSISVTFYGYSNNQIIFTINIEGSSDNIRELSQKASIAITEKLNIKHEIISMDPAKEAALLIQQAKTFEAFKDYRRARILYESALAIEPDSIDSIMGLLLSVDYLSREYGFSEIIGEKRELYKREIIPLYLNNIMIVKQLSQNYSAIKTKYGIMTPWDSIIHSACYVFDYQSRIYRMLGNHEDTLDILRTLQIYLNELYPSFLDMVKIENNNHTYAQTIQMFLYSGYWWAPSPREYLNNVIEWLELSINKGPNWYFNLLQYSYNFENCPLWSNRTDNTEIYLAFLENLSKHSNPLIRACAFQAFTDYYIDHNIEMAPKYYNSFIDTSVNEVIPTSPEWGHIMATWSPNLHSKVIKAVGEKYIAESKVQIIYQILRYSKKFNFGTLHIDISSCYQQLERTGETQQAVQLLLSCRDKLQKEYPDDKNDIDAINSWLSKLKEKHPEVTIDVVEKEKLETIEPELINLLKVEDIPGIKDILNKLDLPRLRNHFAKLLIDETSIAIFWMPDIYRPGRTKNIISAVIWLDPKDFSYKSIQLYEPSLKRSINNIDTQSSSFNTREPIVILADNTVYVSIFNLGIIILPKNGKPKLLSEENGLPSSMITSMDVLNGRIYAITSENRQSGLIEIDPNTMQTRILISPRNREDSHPLDGSTTTKVVADRFFNRLWALSRTRAGNVYYFNPNTLIATPAPSNFDFMADRKEMFKRQGNLLYITTTIYLHIIDLSTNSIVSVVSHNPKLRLPQTPVFWKTDLELDKFAGNSNSLISTAKNEKGEYFIVLFNAEEPEPKRLAKDFFSSFNSFIDLGYTDKGFLILTNDALYLIPHENINTNTN